ncbi:MAG: type VI secretion system-associated FHA domain protein TagH, partial [Methylococcales bacterium]|nr:type VI secretion system-associated FHA domain protein TagH [Methylococcales bacterium]
SVGEAMQALLKPDRKGFLKPVDAIQNGFDDISNHQLAMTAGIQASVSDLLKKFNPQRFESQVDKSVFSTKNTKCWNNYSESYEQIATDAMEDFFGDAFVAAYEQQMRVLESINGPG